MNPLLIYEHDGPKYPTRRWNGGMGIFIPPPLLGGWCSMRVHSSGSACTHRERETHENQNLSLHVPGSGCRKQACLLPHVLEQLVKSCIVLYYCWIGQGSLYPFIPDTPLHSVPHRPQAAQKPNGNMKIRLFLRRLFGFLSSRE